MLHDAITEAVMEHIRNSVAGLNIYDRRTVVGDIVDAVDDFFNECAEACIDEEELWPPPSCQGCAF
jgi:hypothetical protein